MISHMAMAMLLQGPPPNSGDKLGEDIGREVAKSLQDAHVGEQVADAMKQVPWQHLTIIGALTGVMVPLGFFALIGWIIWMLARRNQAGTRAQLELQKQLLDKFTSGREFGEFLESKGGQKFLENALTPSARPLGSSVRSVKIGTVLSVFGLGFLLLSLGVQRHLVVPGVILLALGAGFVLSGFVAHRLSEKWSVNRDNQPGPTNEPVSQS